jgi:DNA-binding beta-propeller fold protein YncE
LEEKYKEDPVIVIGVHSAKFSNEQDKDNIRSAVSRYEIKHPILIDNDLTLWRAYGINAWPSFIVIDTAGNIIGKAAGEGKRDLIESFIIKALEKGKKDNTITKDKLHIEPDLFLESFLKFPGKIAIESKNNHLFISDSNHHRILKIQIEDNHIGKIINTIGDGTKGFKDGSFDKTSFNFPQGIVYQDNKLYVADTGNHAIRVIDFEKELVNTIAGTGKQGYYRKYYGDPLSVSLNSPWDLALDGNLLYIAMAGNHQIWRMDIKANIIVNFAGSGQENIIDGNLEEAALAQPSGLSFDKSTRRLYFVDSEVSALRFVDLNSNELKTLIGKGLFKFGIKSGTFEESLLQHPLGLDIKNNQIFVADTYNHAIRVADLTTGTLSNLIFRPRKGICKIGDKDCDVLPLYEPNDIKYFQNKLFIADTNNHLIRIFDIEKKELSDLHLY